MKVYGTQTQMLLTAAYQLSSIVRIVLGYLLTMQNDRGCVFLFYPRLRSVSLQAITFYYTTRNMVQHPTLKCAQTSLLAFHVEFVPPSQAATTRRIRFLLLFVGVGETFFVAPTHEAGGAEELVTYKPPSG